MLTLSLEGLSICILMMNEITMLMYLSKVDKYFFREYIPYQYIQVILNESLLFFIDSAILD